MKKLFLILIIIISILISPFTLKAEWIKSYNILEHKYDKAVSIGQTADTGYIVLNDDMTVLKLTPEGAVQWAANYYRWCDNTPRHIIETSDLGYVILANHISTDLDNCTGNNKLWVIKLDSTGQVLWQKTYMGADSSMDAAQIREVPVDNGYIFAGNSKNSETDTDIWLIRIDNSGNVIWQKTYSISGILLAGSVLYDQANTRIVVSGSMRQQGSNYLTGIIIRLDNNGLIDWSSRYSNVTDFKSIIQDNSSYIAAGTMIDFENNTDAVVVKVNADNGTVVWGGKYGVTYKYENIKEIIKTDDGGYAFICDTDLYGQGGYDAWLTKIDSSGLVQWGRTFGGEKNESVLILQRTADSGFIVGGYTKSFPGDTEYFNMFLMKLPISGDYDNCTKVGKFLIPGSSININFYTLTLTADQMSPAYISDTFITEDYSSSTYELEIVCKAKDSDGDGILDDGDNSGIAGDNPCPSGITVNCDDNCINDCNVLQLNYDDFADDIGDVCDRDPQCDRVCGPNPCETKCTF